MKELLLVLGLAGIGILIVTAINKWGTTQKLKGITGKVGHLDISFWWRLTAVLLAIGVAYAIWPDIVMRPWRENKLATVLGGLLLLGLLIQWARQGEKKKEGSLLAVVGIALLIAAGLWGLWWVYQQANRPPESYAVERVVAVQVPVQQPPATWHGLKGGVEKTLTLTGEWSEVITVSPTHKVRWDDAPRNVLMRISGTNVMPIWAGLRTNEVRSIEFRTEDGALATLQVATGIPVR